MEGNELPRNSNGLRLQIYFLTGTILFAFFILWLLLLKVKRLSVDSLTPFHIVFDTLILMMVAGVLLILMILYMQRAWAKERYYLKGGLLVVVNKHPITNATTEDVYRVDTVITASVRQSAAGKRYGYGDILLSIPKLGNNDVLALKDVVNPRQEVLKFHKTIDTTDGSGFAITS